MIEILAISFAIGLVCNGAIIVTSNGQLFYPVRRFIEYFLAEHWLYKPLLLCASCMPSIWGTAIYLIYFGVTPEIWYQLPIVLLSSVTISTIINQQFV